MTSPEPTQATRPALLGAEPQLFVVDVAASCAFYTERLGFVGAFTYDAPPYYAQVQRDNARLNLRCVAHPVVD